MDSNASDSSVSLDPQIVPRSGIVYEGDLSITISMVIFIGLAVAAVFWARRYPDHRRNPEKEFVVFLLDPKNPDRGARVAQAGVGDQAGRGSQDQDNHPGLPPPPPPPGGQGIRAGDGPHGVVVEPNHSGGSSGQGGGAGGGSGGGAGGSSAGGHGGASHSGTPRTSLQSTTSSSDHPHAGPSKPAPSGSGGPPAHHLPPPGGNKSGSLPPPPPQGSKKD